MLAEKFSRKSIRNLLLQPIYPGPWKVSLTFCDYGYSNTFRNRIVLKPIATCSVRDKNTKFESDRNILMLEKIQAK